MVLQIIFTDDQIRTFFEANGFEVEDREFGQWSKNTHRPAEWMTATHPAVLLKGRYVKARDLFNRIAEKQMRKYLAPVNMEARRNIEGEFKQMTICQSTSTK